MKRFICLIVLLFCTLLAMPASAAEDQVTLRVNGVIMTPDVSPKVINERIMVPVRFVSTSLGAIVDWDEKSNTVFVTTDGKKYTSKGKDSTDIMIMVNGQPLSPDVPPKVIEGRVMVPVRFVAEALKCRVGWSEKFNTVTITAKKYTTEHTNVIPIGDIHRTQLEVARDLAEKAYLKIKKDLPPSNDTIFEVYLYPDQEAFNKGISEFDKDLGRMARETFLAYLGPNIVFLKATNLNPVHGSYLAWSYLNLGGKKWSEINQPNQYPLLPGDYQWNSITTKYFQVFYYDKADYAREISAQLDQILMEVEKQTGHRPSPAIPETGLIPVYIMDEIGYGKYFSSAKTLGIWSRGYMFINSLYGATVKDAKNLQYSVLRHEIMHGATISNQDTRADNMPVWFIEGMAYFHDDDKPYGKGEQNELYFARQMLQGKPFTWESISYNSERWEIDPKTSSLESASIWAYLARTYGEKKIIDIFYTEGNFEDIIRDVTGKSLEELEKDWKEYIKKTPPY